jgi:hypothetical protein
MRTTLGRLRSTVEMTGPWKTWKTRLRFPTFPAAPWKSLKARFPHSHRAAGDPYSRKTEDKNQTTATGAFTLRMNTCPSPLRQGIKSCALSQPPMAGFEVTPYGR